MIHHLFFDLLAYSVSISISLLFFNPKKILVSSEDLRYIYYTFLIIGFVGGAILFGSINNIYSLEKSILGKSILGAIFGGTFMVELYKKIYKIKGSTGAYFVPSLALGIAIGRIGCFFTGLEDYTYGIQTTSIFAYDFGDGVMRHPVQLYESFLMTLFFIFSVTIFINNRLLFQATMFYYFILFYASERFILEFLKPYKSIIVELNLFQILCLILIFYSLYQLRKSYALLRN